MRDDRLPDRSLLPPSGSRVHVVGVAGAGMSGLAALLAAGGYLVSGSDLRMTPAARRLEASGVRLVAETDLETAREADLLVHTSAASPDHPMLRTALAAGVPVLKRARAMGALLNGRRLVAVAGTHGKTTVTAMIARVAEAAELDPIALVGGRVEEWDGNARAGAGDTAVAEADEYDRSFLQLDPCLAVITSVEPEHMECYQDRADLMEAFRDFARRAEERDGILACAEEPGAREAVEGLGAVRTYGLAPEADCRVQVVERRGLQQTCRITSPDGVFEFALDVPGDHNVQNAGAAMAAGLTLGIAPDALADALAGFHGVERRLQVLGDRDGRIVVDDYAHHPTEVAASIAALREVWPHREIAVVFQPHLFSRTRDMARDLAASLTTADAAAVLPIYPARERPIPGVSSRLVAEASGENVLETSVDAVAAWIEQTAEGAVVAFMGAGDVTCLAHRLVGGGEVDRVGE